MISIRGHSAEKQTESEMSRFLFSPLLYLEAFKEQEQQKRLEEAMSGRIAFLCGCEEQELLLMRLPDCFNFRVGRPALLGPVDLPAGVSQSSPPVP